MNRHTIDEIVSLPIRPIENLTFQSLGEYACAKLLEKYTGWKGMDGVTFQILVGRAIFDFRIRDTFIEYHPISLRREFITEALGEIMSAARKLNKPERLKIMGAISTELSAQYAKRRGQTLAAHPSYGSMELICANSPEEFITKVIFRFSEIRCPSLEELTREFRTLQKQFGKDQINNRSR